MDFKQILQKLCTTPGVVGSEGSVAALTAGILRGYATEVEVDSFYNVSAIIKQPEDGQPMVMLDAHSDQIGMIVTHIELGGFLRVGGCGGIDRRILLGQEVVALGKQPLVGVVCSTPPHLTKGKFDKVPDLDSLLIDMGMPKEQLSELLSLGDRVVIRPQFHALLGNRVAGSAMDDRAGIAVILRAIELLKTENPACGVSVLFSAQEEIGQRGAIVGGQKSKPDIAIAVDVSFAKTPDCQAVQPKEMGEGPMIGIAPTLDAAISQQFITLAKQAAIPHQVEVMSGLTHTNADFLGLAHHGVKTGLLSLPLKYMHTPVELIDLTDCENTAKLLCAYLCSFA